MQPSGFRSMMWKIRRAIIAKTNNTRCVSGKFPLTPTPDPPPDSSISLRRISPRAHNAFQLTTGTPIFPVALTISQTPGWPFKAECLNPQAADKLDAYLRKSRLWGLGRSLVKNKVAASCSYLDIKRMSRSMLYRLRS